MPAAGKLRDAPQPFLASRYLQILPSPRRWARISWLVRVLWVAVVALHAWLLLRRMIGGEWTGLMDYVRAGLCVVAVGYATLKVWRVATIFDSAPSRAWLFALTLLIGHGMIAGPVTMSSLLAAQSGMSVTTMLVVVPTLGAAALLALGFGRRVWWNRAGYQPAPVPALVCLEEISQRLRRLSIPSLSNRPPPCPF